MSRKIPCSSIWESVAPVAKSLASVCRMYGLSGLWNASVNNFCITSFKVSKDIVEELPSAMGYLDVGMSEIEDSIVAQWGTIFW